MKPEIIESFHDMISVDDRCSDPGRVIVGVFITGESNWYITWNRSVTFSLFKLTKAGFVEMSVRTSDTEVDGMKDACKRAKQWYADMCGDGFPID